jgi:hypothetical protein
MMELETKIERYELEEGEGGRYSVMVAGHSTIVLETLFKKLWPPAMSEECVSQFNFTT